MDDTTALLDAMNSEQRAALLAQVTDAKAPQVDSLIIDLDRSAAAARGLALGGDITLYYDGEPVGSGRVDRTQPIGFSADEACDIGRDTGSSPSPDYRPGTSAFTGTINWVEIDTGDDDHDHLVTAEDRMRIAMGKQ